MVSDIEVSRNNKSFEIILTVIPPPAEWDASKVERKAFEVSSVAKTLDLKYINLPEVIEEKARTQCERSVPYKLKVDNALFGEILKGFYEEAVIILNKVTPIMEKDDFIRWLKIHSTKFNHLVIVGSESSKIIYPGFNPIDAAKVSRNYISNIYGITIFERRNEPERLLEKTKAGMKAFISQICFGLEDAKKVINRYYELCNSEGVAHSKIFISFAPISKLKDLEFLKWLGVKIPPETEKFLTENEKKIEKRSIEIIEDLAYDLYSTNGDFGINVEHVMYENLQIAAYTIHRIKEVCRY